jgi:hypothetical protein
MQIVPGFYVGDRVCFRANNETKGTVVKWSEYQEKYGDQATKEAMTYGFVPIKWDDGPLSCWSATLLKNMSQEKKE